MKNERIVLAIETGVRGGSLSLSRNGTEIDRWIGAAHISKAEDVLAETAKLLNNNNIAKTDVRLIKISNGPGSLTGLRVGRALALGFGKATGALVKAVPLLEAMALAGGRRQNSISAVPFGKNQIYWQFCQSKIAPDKSAIGFNKSNGEPNLTSAAVFLSELAARRNVSLVIHDYLYKILKADSENRFNDSIKIRKVENLANLIGEAENQTD